MKKYEKLHYWKNIFCYLHNIIEYCYWAIYKNIWWKIDTVYNLKLICKNKQKPTWFFAFFAFRLYMFSKNSACIAIISTSISSIYWMENFQNQFNLVFCYFSTWKFLQPHELQVDPFYVMHKWWFNARQRVSTIYFTVIRLFHD